MERQMRDWVKLIQEQEESNEPVNEFCIAKGIHPTTFFKNRKIYSKHTFIEIPGPTILVS